MEIRFGVRMAGIVHRPEGGLHDGPSQQLIFVVDPQSHVGRIIQSPGTDTVGQVHDVQVVGWRDSGEPNHRLDISFARKLALTHLYDNVSHQGSRSGLCGDTRNAHCGAPSRIELSSVTRTGIPQARWKFSCKLYAEHPQIKDDVTSPSVTKSQAQRL
jgi:hypothetical protein